MALAILRLEDDGFDGSGEGGRARFLAELGTNRYFSWAIGDREMTRTNGLRVLANRKHVSSVLGPVDESARGRATFDIPADLFDRDNRYVQLMTYRTRDRAGPAVSDVIAVPAVGWGRDARDARDEPGGREREGRGSHDGGRYASGLLPDDRLPTLSFARSGPGISGTGGVMQNGQSGSGTCTCCRSEGSVVTTLAGPAPSRLTTSAALRSAGARREPFCVRERRPSYAEAQFLGALLPMLPKLLPVLNHIIPAVGQFIGGRLGAPAAGGGDTAGQVMDTVRQLIESITKARPPAPAAAAPTQPAAAAPQAVVPQAALALSARAARRLGPYSQAQFAPLLTLLPMIANAVKDLAPIGAQIQAQEDAHLRALNPGVANPELTALLATLGAAPRPDELRYRRIPSVRLHFADLAPQMIHGRERVLVRHGADLAFPMAVETPRPIGQALLQLTIKDAKSLDVIVERRFRVAQAGEGRIPVVPKVERERLRDLAAGRDYLVCITLVWKNGKGRKVGTSVMQPVSVVADLTFDRVEESGELIPLNDVDRFRDFWHKVYQTSFTDDRRRLKYDCKYYYALAAERDGNGRMQTLTRAEKQGLNREEGRLKSGLLVSPFALNALIPQISSEQPLGEAELSALKSDDFAGRFNQAARHKLSLHGRAGDSAALWVWPEVKMQTVVLKTVDEANENGQVVRLSERPVKFPIPALVHFVGAASTS